MSDLIAPVREAVAGKYEILHRIGEGAFASVFLARDLRHDREVAIKILRIDMTSDRGERRFVREIRLLAQLQHPNILPLHDSGHAGNLLYYVMPFVAGDTLRVRLRRERRLALHEALTLGRDLAHALAHAHDAGVIHRDVKPENVLLSDGRPMLADFGIATAAKANLRITQPGDGVPGTPAYMSPEQLLGERDLDARTDIYALACLIHEAVTGSPPFAGRDGYVRRFTGPLPSISDTCKDAPKHAVRVLQRGLAASRDDRFHTAREFAHALDDMIATTRRSRRASTNGRPGSAAPISGAKRGATPRAERARAIARPLNSFVGRERELATVLDLLRNDRCVTLVGQGGVGKTRLAQEVATAVAPALRHGVYVVPLGGVASPESIWAAVGEAVGVSGSQHRDARSGVLGTLRRRHCLIVLDSFEHLVHGRHVVATLLQEAPQVRLLVTSRERLQLTAESVVALRGLPTRSQGDDVAPSDQAALALFVDRARRAQAGFVLDAQNALAITQICEMVEGLPLAIEMSASLVSILDCQEIAADLRTGLQGLSTSLQDVPPRHRNLRAVFDQSWSLLDDEQRNCLLALSVFEDGFSREGALKVADASLPILRTLADKSLVQKTGPDRYRLHQVVGHHARERLRTSDAEGASQDRHATYFAEFMQARASRLYGAEQKIAADEIGAELSDVRAGWRHAVARERCDWMEAYLDALYQFFRLRSWYREGAAEFEFAQRSSVTDVATARALARFGTFHFRLGNIAIARLAHRRSMAMLRHLGRRDELMHSYANMGEIALALGRARVSERMMRRALALSEKTGHPHAMGMALTDLSLPLMAQGKLAEGEQALHRARAILEPLGETLALCTVLNNLGCALMDRGEWPASRQTLQRGLDAARVLGASFSVGAALINLGFLEHLAGDHDGALSRLAEALEIMRGAGVEEGVIVAMLIAGDVEAKVGRHQEAFQRYQQALQSALQLQNERRVMAVLVSLAGLYARVGEATRACAILDIVLEQRAMDANERDRATELRQTLVREGAPPTPTGGLQSLQSLIGEMLTVDTSRESNDVSSARASEPSSSRIEEGS